MLPPKIGDGVLGSREGGLKGFFSSFFSVFSFSLVSAAATDTPLRATLLEGCDLLTSDLPLTELASET